MKEGELLKYTEKLQFRMSINGGIRGKFTNACRAENF
jgi:hypothetical protein